MLNRQEINIQKSQMREPKNFVGDSTHYQSFNTKNAAFSTFENRPRKSKS